MKLDIVIAILAFINTIGFYTGAFDWLLIYYGCAPNEVKEKADRDKILGTASISSIIIFALMIADIMVRIFGYDYIVKNSIRIAAAVVLLMMLVITFILSNENLLYSTKQLIRKMKTPFKSVKTDIETKNAHDELVANRAEKAKIKAEKRAEYLRMARIRSKNNH